MNLISKSLVVISIAFAVDIKISTAQNSNYKNLISKQQNIGLRLSRAKLPLLANYIKEKSSNSKLSTKDYLIATRLYNTIRINQIDSLVWYKKFYFEKLMNNCVVVLNAKLDIGKCFYSKKYHIYIGGLAHKNSQYKLFPKSTIEKYHTSCTTRISL